MYVYGISLNICVFLLAFSPSYCEVRLHEKNVITSREKGHHHHVNQVTQKPCDICPRGGKCVPRVQCPAHVRANSFNPECHLGKTGLLGVCCTTGSKHAAEADHKARSSSSISVQDIKSSHVRSRQKLDEWLRRADQLARSPDAVVNESSPSFSHHLSLRTHDRNADKLGRGGLLNIFATQELSSRQAMSRDQLQLDFTGHTDGPFCLPPHQCPTQPARYRNMDGKCNNPHTSGWGAVHTGYERILPPDYSDGVWEMRMSSSGLPLPSARAVSSNLLLDADIPSPVNNLMFMQFGQFIAHDTTSAVMFTIGNSSAISCCSGDGESVLPPELQHWACAPILVATDDPFYQTYRHQCINFVRTQLAPSQDCSVGYAKQMNGVTHFLDLSQLYGSSEDKMKNLKDREGQLKTFTDYGRELPPVTEKQECLIKMKGSACFESGDSHGNQVISLTVFHTLWTREHNRISRALFRLNPDWSEDVIFYEARRILQAEFQHIVYNEWLPLLLGPTLMVAFGLTPAIGYAVGYDPAVNPSLTAEFAAAAFRFGHSIVDGKISVPNTRSGSMYEVISLPEVMFEPSRMRLRPFLDRLLVGMGWQPMQSVDPFITESLTRYLFHSGNPFGLDLASINIQRGRDFGLRPYNDYRKLTGQPPFSDFGQFSPKVAERLASVYASPEDIDLWIGGLLEEPVYGGIVGATFANIIADQFSRSKRGDRYFYEYGAEVNPGAFTLSQLSEIKKVTMSRIICDNRDGIELNSQSPHAFIRADLMGNEPVPCDSPLIPVMDINRFKTF